MRLARQAPGSDSDNLRVPARASGADQDRRPAHVGWQDAEPLGPVPCSRSACRIWPPRDLPSLDFCHHTSASLIETRPHSLWMRSEFPMDELDALSIRDLRAVIALAERLHFGRAAEDLSIAQPSLSAAVKKVEEVLGERLFERTSRHVALTPAGQGAVRRIRSALEEIAEIGRGAGHKALLTGRFRLGLVPTIGPYYAPRFLAGLRQRYPDLELVLTEALTEGL